MRDGTCENHWGKSFVTTWPLLWNGMARVLGFVTGPKVGSMAGPNEIVGRPNCEGGFHENVKICWIPCRWSSGQDSFGWRWPGCSEKYQTSIRRGRSWGHRDRIWKRSPRAGKIVCLWYCLDRCHASRHEWYWISSADESFVFLSRDGCHDRIWFRGNGGQCY